MTHLHVEFVDQPLGCEWLFRLYFSKTNFIRSNRPYALSYLLWVYVTHIIILIQLMNCLATVIPSYRVPTLTLIGLARGRSGACQADKARVLTGTEPETVKDLDVLR